MTPMAIQGLNFKKLCIIFQIFGPNRREFVCCGPDTHKFSLENVPKDT